MFREVFLSVTLFFFLQNCSAYYDCFWKDYYGTIPDSAFVAGEDEIGNVYIGQGLVVGHGLYPGTLRKDNVSLEVYAREYAYINQSIKIFCANSDLRWVTTKHPLCPNLTSHRVCGGSDFGYPTEGCGGNLYIIKVNKDGQTHIGYMLRNKTFLAFNHTLYHGFDTYEVLVYADEDE